MVTPSVKVNYRIKRQYGASLVEMLLASGLGLITLISVGTIFVAGQKMAASQTQDLYLMQSLSGVLKFIKNDARRAGFTNIAGASASLVLSDKDKVINTSADTLSYVYTREDSTNSNKYTVVSLKQDTHKGQLLMCSVDVAIDQSPEQKSCTDYHSMFDPNRVKVKAFQVDSTALGSAGNSSLITVSVTAALTGNPQVEKSLSATLMQRNML